MIDDENGPSAQLTSGIPQFHPVDGLGLRGRPQLTNRLRSTLYEFKGLNSVGGSYGESLSQSRLDQLNQRSTRRHTMLMRNRHEPTRSAATAFADTEQPCPEQVRDAVGEFLCSFGKTRRPVRSVGRSNQSLP